MKVEMKKIEEMIGVLRERLLAERPADGSVWRGRLSSSAISTSVSVFALHVTDRVKYAARIRRGTEWLQATMLADGSWGDSPESPSNMTATLLSYASLCAVGAQTGRTRDFLNERFGGSTDRHIIRGILACYGKDLTFSVPILVMCALAGVISRWDEIPQLPFEVSVLPQKLFRFLRLPVVSYAIPALIAVGILRCRKGPRNVFSSVRELFVGRSLKALERLQPSNGGFLEAAPLTAFVTMCMSAAGFRDHVTTQRGAGFLTDSVRDDGSWPIDTDLACWVTALSVRALEGDIEDRATLAEGIKRRAFAFGHSFTGVAGGGWAWTDLPGAVPDADDTAGALVALHVLLEGAYCPEVGRGIEWLLRLRNVDGGMPTFCRGWGLLPFDRSSPDISAHAIRALRLWQEALPDGRRRRRCRRGMLSLLGWMRKTQAEDGSWTPLWFGDQDAVDERSPVYATALAVEYLADSVEPVAREVVLKGVGFLLSAQNTDGGWGGARGVPSKVTLTARALSALASCWQTGQTAGGVEPMRLAAEFLVRRYEDGELFRPEPIGLYFSRLWYSEKLYNVTFVLHALKRFRLLDF
jgi:squalene-hopene/tetraprenyl-beta-curcumene cyclase